jgi:hypothetical protein
MSRWEMLNGTEEASGGEGDVWGGKGDELTLIRHFDSFTTFMSTAQTQVQRSYHPSSTSPNSLLVFARVTGLRA